MISSTVKCLKEISHSLLRKVFIEIELKEIILAVIMGMYGNLPANGIYNDNYK